MLLIRIQPSNLPMTDKKEETKSSKDDEMDLEIDFSVSSQLQNQMSCTDNKFSNMSDGGEVVVFERLTNTNANVAAGKCFRHPIFGDFFL